MARQARLKLSSLGLGHRFALANLAVGLTLVAALVYVQTRGAKAAIRQRAMLGAELALEQAAAICRSRLEKGQRRALFDDLQPLVQLQRFVYIDVFDPQGRPVLQLTHPERHRGLTQEQGLALEHDDVLVVSRQLVGEAGPLGRLDIGVWVRGIQDDLRRIERDGIAVGLGLCAALVLVSWGLGRRLSSRLRRLTDELQRRAPDDFDPLDVPGADEVGRLAGAFNRRQERLREERARREAAEAHRQDMVHMIVHDMKGPLSVFRSGMPFLKERAAETGDERVMRMIEMFAEGAGRLLRMAESILNVAKLEETGAELERRPVDLGELARARVEAAAVAARRKGVAVELAEGAALPPVAGDADVLGRVFDNLLMNAVEHTPKGGKVTVELARKSGRLRAVVRDTGPGVPAEEREKIFEKFRKGRASAGVGLGLAFCRLAVEKHGGAIGVEEGPKGKGAAFYFTLPLSLQRGQTPP